MYCMCVCVCFLLFGIGFHFFFWDTGGTVWSRGRFYSDRDKKNCNKDNVKVGVDKKEKGYKHKVGNCLSFVRVLFEYFVARKFGILY